MKMIGIIDEFGIDSFIPLEGHYKEALLFIIRSKINLQRNAVFFCIDYTEKEVNKINNLVSSHEVKSYNDAGVAIIEKINLLNKGNAKTDNLLNRFYKLKERFKQGK